MAYVSFVAEVATENKITEALAVKEKEKERVSEGSDEIIIRIKNGSVISFVKNVHFSALEGLNGDGI